MPAHAPSAWSARWPERSRTDKLKSTEWWLALKREADDLPEHLHRVHDTLYDLTSFADKHPGGGEWIRLTRGTDITELFESSHLNSKKVKAVLQQYEAQPAWGARNSPFTFEADGFYQTLKKRVFEEIGSSTQPSTTMCLMNDAVLMLFLATSWAAASSGKLSMAVASGVFLAMLVGIAHNFYHQRDNWRMFGCDVSLLSSHEWRVSHCYSHHCFPNAVMDAEVLFLEPIYIFLPGQIVPEWIPFAALIYSHLVSALVFHGVGVLRVVGLVSGEKVFRPENLLPIAHLCLVCQLAPCYLSGLLCWNLMQASASFVFITTSLIGGAHHHKDAWHDGTEDHSAADADGARRGNVEEEETTRRAQVQEATGRALMNVNGHTGAHASEWRVALRELERTGVLSKDEIDHLEQESQGASAAQVEKMLQQLRELLGKGGHAQAGADADADVKPASATSTTTPSEPEAASRTNCVDFGVWQIATVMERDDINLTLLGRSTMFGDHALHHLFPTVCHSKLPLIRTLFLQTCDEFGVSPNARKGERTAHHSFVGACFGFYELLGTASRRSQPQHRRKRTAGASRRKR